MSNLYMGPEDREQQAIFVWAQLMVNTGRYPELEYMFAVPNGGHRHKATAARLKLTGVKSGVPDICLPVAKGKYHGLYVEIKRAQGGRATPEQKRWIEALNRGGYFAEVCHGCDSAIRVIEWYMNLK